MEPSIIDIIIATRMGWNWG